MLDEGLGVARDAFVVVFVIFFVETRGFLAGKDKNWFAGIEGIVPST